ncbi:MAG: hypothetical protein IH598_11325 [Bacteroidales bacterium]|nr:hypothetical protein [Bacteroidales bacterium]
MRKLYLVSLVLLMVTMLTSCLKTKNEALPLGEVDLGFIEALTPDARYLTFYFFTKEQFPCTNYFINYNYSNDLGNLEIHLKNIEVTDFCLTAAGPATAQMNLGIYQMGAYQVLIKVVNAENSGTLQVTPSQYILTINDPQMLTQLTDTLNRIPENTIWGYVAYNEEEYMSVAAACLDSIEQHGAVPISLDQGNFGYFSLNEEGEINLIDQAEAKFSIGFIYEFEGSDEEINSVIRYFYINHYDEVFLFIRNDDGEVFNSNII